MGKYSPNWLLLLVERCKETDQVVSPGEKKALETAVKILGVS